MPHDRLGAMFTPRYWSVPKSSCASGCTKGMPWTRLSMFDVRELVKHALRGNTIVAAHLSSGIIHWIWGPAQTDVLGAALEVMAPFKFNFVTNFCIVNASCGGGQAPAFFDVLDLVRQLPEQVFPPRPELPGPIINPPPPFGPLPPGGKPFGAWTGGLLHYERRR